MGLPNNWSRTLSIMGLGVTALWLFSLAIAPATKDSVMLALAWGAPNDLSPAGAMNAVFAFMAIFAAYVIGELLVVIGQSYRNCRQEPLRLHAISLFCAETKAEYWRLRFKSAYERDELMSGLTALFIISGLICVANQFFGFSAVGLLSGIGMIAMSVVFSSMATSSYKEIETAMNLLIEVREKTGQFSEPALKNEKDE